MTNLTYFSIDCRNCVSFLDQYRRTSKFEVATPTNRLSHHYLFENFYAVDRSLPRDQPTHSGYRC